MARLITEPYTWDDIVLEEKTKEQIQDGCKRIKYQSKIRDDWGVKTRKGLSMLFYGSSGLGKTMAAQVFANEINMDIYQVDSSKIISKYIGETDKNLKAIFDEARKSNVVLLFDEADAIFSKRTEIKDSHDKNANTTASFLLQMLDTYPGITILTTNFKGNIDEAFERRFTIKASFGSFTTTKNRTDQVEMLKLKQCLFVEYFEKTKLPLDKDIDWSFLITQFNITGGEMRNIAEAAAYEAADENAPTLQMKHILKAIKKELPPTMVDLGKYEYLLKIQA
jgi:SpoVK/Ycf46/Vps4 family AAA+-type ATPase